MYRKFRSSKVLGMYCVMSNTTFVKFQYRPFKKCNSTEKMSKNFERLPKNVKPINYDIFIKANFETFKFNGRVTYNVEVLQPTKIVKMNCADIEIQNAKVQGQDAKHEFDVEQEEVSLIVENEIPVGPASITIEYTGTHNDKMKGFYRTKHVNEDGSSFYSLVTQFECKFFYIFSITGLMHF